eukprot:COSAG06_NODE_1933_length_8038_cov_156.326779_6_plen_25_part_01
MRAHATQTHAADERHRNMQAAAAGC